MVKEKKGQPTWVNLDHQDLRRLPKGVLAVGEQVEAGNSVDEAVRILETEMGFSSNEAEIEISTPIGNVAINRDMLTHIVEKRLDARERYVRMALATMRAPFEIWDVAYDDETTRHAYIGAFDGKTHMLVVVTHVNGTMLWNFMHGDGKAINKHRHGRCLHRMKIELQSEDVPVLQESSV